MIKGYRPPPKLFVLQEFVSKKMFEKYGHKPDYLWRVINPFILEAIVIVRNFYAVPVTVNNWHIDGPYSQSGLRDDDAEDGVEFSTHKFGDALDFRVKGVSSARVQRDIRNNKLPARFYELVNCVEDGTNGWTHIASLNYMRPGITWIPIPRKKA